MCRKAWRFESSRPHLKNESNATQRHVMHMRMRRRRPICILLALLLTGLTGSASCGAAETKTAEVIQPAQPQSAQPQVPPPLKPTVTGDIPPSASVFDYVSPREPSTMQLVDENKLFKKYIVQFPSALVTPYAENPTVSAMYYVPQGRTHFPVVIILPHNVHAKVAIGVGRRTGCKVAIGGADHVRQNFQIPLGLELQTSQVPCGGQSAEGELPGQRCPVRSFAASLDVAHEIDAPALRRRSISKRA